MLSYIQSLSVVAFCVLVALGLCRILSWRLEDSTRKRANGVNGWQLGILGSIYAVVLGFMLSDAWLSYQTATDDVRNEAAAALMIYRTASLLPKSCSVPLQQAAGGYVKTVLESEWPAMQQHRTGIQAKPFLRSMWGTLSNCDSGNMEARQEGIARALQTLQMRRDARTEDATGHLPLIMWSVLVFGAVVVVASSCLLANEKQSVHCFHVVSLTMLISVTLLAISDLDRPFDGATRITSSAFQNARQEISEPAAH